MAKLGFLGLGIMGAAMARNLINAGMDITVWNRDPKKSEPLVELGATLGESPADVAASCDITIAMVSDPHAARAIAFGEHGVIQGLSQGKGYVEMSTIDPETSQEIGEAVRAKDARYLEAPVSGSKKPAEDGTLVILAAGERSLYNEMKEAFDIMGKLTVYLGDIGQGSAMKLVVNMVMGGMMTAFCEGIALAQASGLAAEDLFAVLDAGAISNPMFRLKGPQIEQESFPTAFPLKHMQKDMRLALALAEEHAVPMPTAAAANSSFLRARSLDLGDKDFAAVWQAIKPPKA
ncbi:MAG: NAD(P)-dependent oxidoreductase [Myxococcales bacterium]|nr:NAD(P)-dependent oxidoreductase [Myxococcales bacterium]MCB9642362.1 NAD(P)-dependent oxidoreductase [Myxococcales bacterium]